MKNSSLSRRKFVCTAAAASAATMFPIGLIIPGGQKTKKPNSKVSGVQLGCTTYSYLSMPHNTDECLSYLLEAGINAVEMRSVLEESLGIPQRSERLPRDADDKTKVEYAKASEAFRETQRKWRLSVPMWKYSDIRKKYNDAGVDIHIAKFAPSRWSDEEINYAFNAAMILGAYGITDECSDEACKRLGDFAEKHKSLAIFHTHQQFAEPGFDIEKLLAYSAANRLNFDAGHFYGSTGLHPNTIIEKYHQYIPMIHIKDKTGPKSNPPNTNKPFGEGETPIADILQLIKKEKWPIDVFVELEYPIPKGSDASKEVKKTIDYMRNILE